MLSQDVSGRLAVSGLWVLLSREREILQYARWPLVGLLTTGLYFHLMSEGGQGQCFEHVPRDKDNDGYDTALRLFVRAVSRVFSTVQHPRGGVDRPRNCGVGERLLSALEVAALVLVFKPLACFIHFGFPTHPVYLCNGNFLMYTKVGRGVEWIIQSKQLSASCLSSLICPCPPAPLFFWVFKAHSFGTFCFVEASLYQHAVLLKVKGPPSFVIFPAVLKCSINICRNSAFRSTVRREVDFTV